MRLSGGTHYYLLFLLLFVVFWQHCQKPKRKRCILGLFPDNATMMVVSVNSKVIAIVASQCHVPHLLCLEIGKKFAPLIIL